jgi:RimJ/RimL family protein N-acetyltransferase
MALVATTGEGEDEWIVGVVRYERISPESAEVAFDVEDTWQGQGISTSLLHMLAAYARPRGFKTFVAVTMGSNIRMLDVLRHCGYPLTRKYMGSEVEVYLDITAPPQPAFAVSR